MESAGNYVNLDNGGQIYPLPSTLADLSKPLAAKGFYRTHRYYTVNFSAFTGVIAFALTLILSL